ncbi:MAG: hypothetical protein AAF468_19335 [Pseudomonadota bacterium]
MTGKSGDEKPVKNSDLSAQPPADEPSGEPPVRPSDAELEALSQKPTKAEEAVSSASESKTAEKSKEKKETDGKQTVDADGGNDSVSARIFSGLKWFSIGGITLWGLVIFMAFSFSHFSGFIDYWRPSTKGTVWIETPQIYTRERLVNDRFREKAWLEQRLENLDETEGLITSLGKTTLAAKIAGGTEPAKATAETPATPDLAKAAKLVDALDAFEKIRNRRARIRTALIENELDDRHDLGANSLYMFNFGAAVAAGPRTRNPLLIKMHVERGEESYPFHQLVRKPDHPCGDGLITRFECAWLIELNVVTPTGADFEQRWLAELDRWRTLYNRWIQFENASYRKEADDIRRLLQAESARIQLNQTLKPYFSRLEKKAELFAESLRQLMPANAGPMPAGALCKMSASELSGSFGKSLEDHLRELVKQCIRFVEHSLIYIDPKRAQQSENSSLRQEDTVVQVEATKAITQYPPGIVFNDLLKNILQTFNKQCAWSDPILRRVASGDGQEDRFKVFDKYEDRVLACIVNAIIRDFGSHPLSKMEREQAHTDDAVTRTIQDLGESRRFLSNYRIKSGLRDIFTAENSLHNGYGARTQFAAFVARNPAGGSGETGESRSAPISFAGERLNYTNDQFNAACSAIKNPIDTKSETPFQIGITTNYHVVKPQTTHVDKDIGWNLLIHFLCKSWARDEFDEDGSEYANDLRHIPVGLFRFITTLSKSQRTFSYSVHPRAEFDLEGREQEKSWSLSGILPGNGPSASTSATGSEASASVKKHYRIIGFSSQQDLDDSAHESDAVRAGGAAVAEKPAPATKAEAKRRAVFGWYVMPDQTRGFLGTDPRLSSANLNLSALISLPAWWDSVRINVDWAWVRPGTVRAGPPRKDEINTRNLHTQTMRIELPTRLEFLRNHFSRAGGIGPSLDRLRIQRRELKACQKAEIVIYGERLWRSTAVTLGSQKASLIQVMPNMRGIIATFDQVRPYLPKAGELNELFGVGRLAIQGSPDANSDKQDVPLTVWTSEGHVTLVDTYFVNMPKDANPGGRAPTEPCATNAPSGGKG